MKRNNWRFEALARARIVRQELEAKKKKIDIYDNPTWILFECEKGNHWTAVKGGLCERPIGENCNFSGCDQDHRVFRRGETTERSKAIDWCKRVN